MGRHAQSTDISQLPQTLGHVSSILRRLLIESLDADIFAISSSRPTDNNFTSRCTLVLPDAREVDQSKWFHILHSPQHAGSIAVVDRTADVIKTAQTISNASFAFRGGSPYSPHVVLVNEYICDQLLSALAVNVVNPKPGVETELASLKGDGKPTYLRQHKSADIPKKVNVKDIISGSNGSIVELLDG